MAKFLGISIYDKPPSACLATRIPHGTRITLERVEKVRDGELFLRGLGFRVVRVRDHGDIARIEVGVDELGKLLEPDVRNSIANKLKSLGYKYVTVDLEGAEGPMHYFGVKEECFLTNSPIVLRNLMKQCSRISEVTHRHETTGFTYASRN